MIRRNKRKELNIFTMSALDLFASSLGAFVLISVIALPYYLNEDNTEVVTVQKERISKLEAKVSDIVVKYTRCKKEFKKSATKVGGLREQNEALKNSLESKNDAIASLEHKLDDSIKLSLMGISTKATSFTIVVDMSGSMQNYKVTIEDTIRRLIEPMKNKSKIQIIGYSGDSSSPDIISWHSPYQSELYNTHQLSSLDRFIRRIIDNLANNTPTKIALSEALKYNNEAIVLLTDGEPNGKPSDVVNYISRLNNSKQEIHTIAIGNYLEEKKLTQFLINLSSRNRGGFMGVASLD